MKCSYSRLQQLQEYNNAFWLGLNQQEIDYKSHSIKRPLLEFHSWLEKGDHHRMAIGFLQFMVIF